ncbi:MAG: hypothetical protein AAF349_27485 [Cyanobacteria bacterium P01_A01_bin.68]
MPYGHALLTPPYMKEYSPLLPLQGTVYRYDDPTEPVGLEDWKVLQ